MASCGLHQKQRSSGSLCRSTECDGCRPYRPRAPAAPPLADSVTEHVVPSGPVVPDFSHTPLMQQVEAARVKHEERRFQLVVRLAEASVRNAVPSETSRAHVAAGVVGFADEILTALAAKPPVGGV